MEILGERDDPREVVEAALREPLRGYLTAVPRLAQGDATPPLNLQFPSPPPKSGAPSPSGGAGSTYAKTALRVQGNRQPKR